MRKYLLILFSLPILAQVPDTNTFSLVDVLEEINSKTCGSLNSLSGAFNSSVSDGFNPVYEGSKDRLSNFRGYSHKVLYNTNKNFTLNRIPRGVFVTKDGNHLYFIQPISGNVEHHQLTTPYDISTATNGTTLSIGSTFIEANSVYVTNGGGTMYVVLDGGAINQYSLSTAYDITTATYIRNYTFPYSFADVDRIALNSSGLKGVLTYVSGSSKVVQEITLSSSFDISTINIGGSFSVTQENDFSFSPRDDGKGYYLAYVHPLLPNNVEVLAEFKTPPWDGILGTQITETPYCLNNVSEIYSAFPSYDGKYLYVSIKDTSNNFKIVTLELGEYYEL
ncbi:hypothetical protein [Joostella sp. CR20]|uniref:hypothetical protein n=1 Tax=Joostella sp. CR20 TaxID=2804312 RepID=UPI00313B1464